MSQQMMIDYKFELIERIIHGQRYPKLFYDESCRDYSNIASENMVFFTSEKEAKKAGYKKSKTYVVFVVMWCCADKLFGMKRCLVLAFS